MFSRQAADGVRQLWRACLGAHSTQTQAILDQNRYGWHQNSHREYSQKPVTGHGAVSCDIGSDRSRMTGAGDTDRAPDVARTCDPLSGICGRVCTQPYEVE